MQEHALNNVPDELRAPLLHSGVSLKSHTVKKVNLLLLHGARSFLRSWPVFAASQEIPCIFMEPESSLPYSKVPATRLYLEPTPSSPHDSLQLPEDPS